jgi:hypothetical protein
VDERHRNMVDFDRFNFHCDADAFEIQAMLSPFKPRSLRFKQEYPNSLMAMRILPFGIDDSWAKAGESSKRAVSQTQHIIGARVLLPL